MRMISGEGKSCLALRLMESVAVSAGVCGREKRGVGDDADGVVGVEDWGDGGVGATVVVGEVGKDKSGWNAVDKESDLKPGTPLIATFCVSSVQYCPEKS